MLFCGWISIPNLVERFLVMYVTSTLLLYFLYFCNNTVIASNASLVSIPLLMIFSSWSVTTCRVFNDYESEKQNVKYPKDPREV